MTLHCDNIYVLFRLFFEYEAFFVLNQQIFGFIRVYGDHPHNVVHVTRTIAGI